MFTTDRVAALLKKVSFDIVEMKEDTHRIANCHFKIAPLPYDLACEIGTDVAEHLFRVHKQRGKDDAYEVRGEIVDVAFKVDTDRFYAMSLFSTDDVQVPASAAVATCFCQKLRVKKDPKSPMLSAEFIATFEVDDPAVLWRVINRWHSTERTFVTFVETEAPAPPLDFEAEDDSNGDD